MRIAFISTMIGGPWGGSEELWADAARQARADGLEVDASVYRSRPRSKKLDDLAALGVHVTERPLHPRPIANAIDRVLPPFRAVSAKRPDVVCISMGFPFDTVIRQLPDEIDRLTDKGRIPYVAVCQYNADDLVIPAGGLETARKLYGRAAAAVFVSDHNRLLAERQLAMRLPRAITLRNPVNLSDTSPVPWPSASATLRMATVARLSAGTKGLDILLNVLADLSWRDRDWRLELCGQGPDEPYLRELAAFVGVGQRVIFRGQVADIRAVWAENEVLLLSSRGEGTPLAMVEAMLCGRPAVVTDVGGNAEWVRDGENGFVADAANIKCFSAAMENMWQRRHDLPALGAAARVTAAERYDPHPGRTLLDLIRAAPSDTKANA